MRVCAFMKIYCHPQNWIRRKWYTKLLIQRHHHQRSRAMVPMVAIADHIYLLVTFENGQVPLQYATLRTHCCGALGDLLYFSDTLAQTTHITSHTPLIDCARRSGEGERGIDDRYKGKEGETPRQPLQIWCFFPVFISHLITPYCFWLEAIVTANLAAKAIVHNLGIVRCTIFSPFCCCLKRDVAFTGVAYTHTHTCHHHLPQTTVLGCFWGRDLRVGIINKKICKLLQNSIIRSRIKIWVWVYSEWGRRAKTHMHNKCTMYLYKSLQKIGQIRIGSDVHSIHTSVLCGDIFIWPYRGWHTHTKRTVCGNSIQI